MKNAEMGYADRNLAIATKHSDEGYEGFCVFAVRMIAVFGRHCGDVLLCIRELVRGYIMRPRLTFLVTSIPERRYAPAIAIGWSLAVTKIKDVKHLLDMQFNMICMWDFGGPVLISHEYTTVVQTYLIGRTIDASKGYGMFTSLKSLNV